MAVVRRDIVRAVGIALSASAFARMAIGQAAQAPRLDQILRKDLDGQGETVQETVVSIAEFGAGVAAPWHMHPGAQELIFAIEGSLTVEAEGRATAKLKTGDAFVIPADLPHLARNDDSNVIARALVVHSRSAKDKPLVVAAKKQG